MSENIYYVSEKINKIRWRPDAFGQSHFFVTGSWDNINNTITLWDFQEKDDDSDIYPFLINSFPITGDVTEIQFLNPDTFVCSSSFGSLYLLKINTSETGGIYISEEKTWDKLHKFKNGDSSSCTCLSVYDEDIVTVSENGSINCLSAEREIVRTIDEADSCSLTCVTFLKHNEILTGNLRGLMKIWDLRCSENEPRKTFMLGDEQIAATCLAYHPTQRHIIVAGDEEGSLSICDLRFISDIPITFLNAHKDSVSEIRFHPDLSDQLFTCSLDGEIWHWQPSGQRQSTLLDVDTLSENAWLSSDIKNKVEVKILMPPVHKPLNSIDLNKDKLLCGADNEAMYLIHGINVY